MKLFLKVFLIVFPIVVNAQLAGKTVHDNNTDSIKKYYNLKQFNFIYNLLSPEVKKATSESVFNGYFLTHYFLKTGQLLRTDYIDKDNNFFYYLSFFEKDTMKLTLSVNPNNAIEEIEFKPIRLRPIFKNLNFKKDNRLLNPLDSLVDNTVKDFMQNGQNCGLSIGIIVNGETFFYNYGETKKGTGELPTSKTIYEIGSITTTFCGNLLAIAVNEAKINLEDDIRKFLPGGFKNLELNKQPILIKHLANHTSGLPHLPSNFNFQKEYDISNPYKTYSKEMIYGYLKTVMLSKEPGKVCEYSNLGIALLGIILEEVYKKPFEELVVEKICRPNKMQDTRINLSLTQLNNFAEGYDENGEYANHWDFAGFYAAGAIRSTTSDMISFINYNLKEADDATKLAHLTTFKDGENIALAWHKMQRKNSKELIWHNGATGGFTGFCGFVKEKNFGFVVLSNSSSRVDFIGLAIYNFLQQ